METLVLVSYATRYGSTRETAHRVAEILERDGIAAEVRAVEDVIHWKPYTAVVLTAALYMGRLHKHARQFLANWREELVRVPVFLMVAGPVDAAEKSWAGAEQQLDKELARIPWFHPAARKMVGGKWDPASLQFPFRWVLRKVPASDARDWNAIDQWANEVAGQLQPALKR